MPPSGRVGELMLVRLLIVYLLMLAGSAFFSAAENAYAAVSKIRLKALADDGSRRAKLVLHLTDRFDQLLSTILISVNILQIGGASVATLFVYYAAGEGGTKAWMTAIATVVTTIVVFFFADLLPKSFAVAHADGFAMTTAPILRVIMWVLYPVAIVFRGLNLLFRKLFGVKEEPTVTEEELSSIIDTVEEEGVIDETQGDLLQSALEFAETTVADVLTLRDDVVAISLTAPHREIMDIFRQNKYSRFPVYDGDLDHIVGILQVREYLKNYLSHEGKTLEELCGKVYYTTLEAEVDHLLEEMSRAKATMAVVQNDEGVTMGVVTVEDFLEELVGEIFDEDDVVNDRFMKLGGDYYRVSATCTMGELFRDMSYRGNVGVSRAKTVGAWVREQFEDLPQEEDTFTWRDLTVTVTDVEDGRVQFVEVKKANPILDAVTARQDADEEVHS